MEKKKVFNSLALNMIVGPGDGNDLKRCLDSFNAKDFFDEIVIVLTTHDKQAEEIARQYTDKVFFREWTSERFPFGDFGGARNFAIDNTESDYIMWLDCDDIIPNKCLKRLPYLKEAVGIHHADYYTLQYRISFVNEDKFSTSTIRERVFKRCDNLRWKHPVHESLTTTQGLICGKLDGVWIEHRETKPHIASLSRNMLIMKHEIDIGEADDMLKSLYALELLGTKEPEAIPEAIQLLKETFYNREIGIVQGASIASRLSIELFNLENYLESEFYARVALDMNKNLAEPHVLLGDCYILKDDVNKALMLYKEALNKELFTGGLQDTSYYKDIPLRRIMMVYMDRGETELALAFNKQALDIMPDDKYLLQKKKELIERLI